MSCGGEDADLRDMAAQLLAMLGSGAWDGEIRGRMAWDKLQRILAQVATSIADPSITLDALLESLQGARDPSFLRLDHPKADAMLRQMMLVILEKTNKEQESGMAITLLREHLLVVAGELGMVPLRDSEPVHMVDADSNFCDANVANIIKCSPQLSAPKAPYAVLSIVGAQSSGKSYLLNRLFGTKFPEMDAKIGRSQTTRGIMMSRCIGPSLLVMDVEGFDGREKGEDTVFEKQAALFALTVSDVMLVNMSLDNVGREQAGGTLLFKTIFKERIKLEAGLTKILVVIRRYDKQTPLEILSEDVMKSLEMMWRSVNAKPLKFEDYIQVNVVALQDMSSQKFPEEVTELRKLLSETTVDHNRSARVPASSFSVSSKMFWDAIRKNKKLDIPSHQEAIAVLHCRQTVDDALKSVDSSEEYKLLKAEESPSRFKERTDALLKSIITMYDNETEMYDQKIRDDGRRHMVEKIKKVFIQDSWELIRTTRRNTSEQFKGQYANNLKDKEETDLDLAHEDHIVDSCVADFMKTCEDLKVFDLDYLHRTCAELQKDLQSYIQYQGLIIKERRARKETEQAQERADKNLEEVIKRYEEATKQKHDAEAEMARQNEKQLRDELESSRQMLADLKKNTDTMLTKHEKMLAAQQEQADKRIAMQQEQAEKKLAEERAQAEKKLTEQKAQAEKMITAEKEHAAKMLAAQEAHSAKTLAAEKQHAADMLAAEQAKCNIM